MVYRCKTSCAALYAWLRTKGITALKPLHELRKELGALLASSHGIYVAQRGLRHANISTTAKTYADKKGRISAGLGSLLTSNIIPFPGGETVATRPMEKKARKA
jgi:integrase